eukprot:1605462-Heterocapsa_arctica.AAC.1
MNSPGGVVRETCCSIPFAERSEGSCSGKLISHKLFELRKGSARPMAQTREPGDSPVKTARAGARREPQRWEAREAR